MLFNISMGYLLHCSFTYLSEVLKIIYKIRARFQSINFHEHNNKHMFNKYKPIYAKQNLK